MFIASVANRTEAVYRVKFTFNTRPGGSGSVDTGKIGPSPYFGLGGNACSNRSPSVDILTEYNFVFLDHRDGNDVYRIKRRVTGGPHDGQEDVVTVEYQGKQTTVFDDEISTDVLAPSTSSWIESE